MSEDFRSIVAGSTELQARWHTTTDHLASKVREDFGVDVSKEELAELTSVRLAVLSGDPDLLSTFDAEIQRHPGVAAALKERELVRALEDSEHPAHDAAQEEWGRLSPQAKITRARQIESAKPRAAKRPEPTRQEKASALKDVSRLRGGARIAEARRRGIA